MNINGTSGAIIGAAMKVHSALGPGLLERAYQVCLKQELTTRGFRVISELAMPIEWEGVKVDIGYRLDFLVEDSIIVELKSAYELALIHRVQLLTYLRLSDKPLGLLLNFGKAHLRDSIVRIINFPSANPCDLSATSALKKTGSGQAQFFDNAKER